MRSAHKTELLGLNVIALEPAFLELADMRRSGYRDLIELIRSKHYHSTLYAEVHKHLCERLNERTVVNAQQKALRACRIGERSEDIEHRPDAELFSDRTYIFHGGVVFLCEEEAEVSLIEHLTALVNVLLDINAESFKAVCRSAERRSCTVAVLGDLYSRRSDYHCRCGRDVEAVSVVSARADYLHKIVVIFKLCCGITHSSCTACYLIYRFRLCRFGGKRCKECSVLRCTCLSRHYLADDLICLIICQILFVYYLYYCLFDHFVFLPHISIKFLSICFPSGVSIDSGWNCTP